MKFRQNVFELLVSAYPATRGKGRWLKLLQRALAIRPYGAGKPLRTGNYTILLDPGDPCDQLFYFGLIGHDHDALLNAILRPGDGVIDIGGNSGHFTALCANLVAPGGFVHTVEANPRLAERMKEAFRSSPEIAVHHAAAGDTAGTAIFAVATFSGWSSLIPNETFDVQERVEVDRLTIDGLIEKQGIGRVRLLKLDIEGGEFGALSGATQALSSGRIDYVFTEVEPLRMKAFGWSVEKLDAFMVAHGYSAVAIKAGKVLVPVEQVSADRGTDILYVRRSLRDEAAAVLFGANAGQMN